MGHRGPLGFRPEFFCIRQQATSEEITAALSERTNRNSPIDKHTHLCSLTKGHETQTAFLKVKGQNNSTLWLYSSVQQVLNSAHQRECLKLKNTTSQAAKRGRRASVSVLSIEMSSSGLF